MLLAAGVAIASNKARVSVAALCFVSGVGDSAVFHMIGVLAKGLGGQFISWITKTARTVIVQRASFLAPPAAWQNHHQRDSWTGSEVLQIPAKILFLLPCGHRPETRPA